MQKNFLGERIVVVFFVILCLFVFSTNDVGTTEHPYAKQKTKQKPSNPYVELCYKINSKWVVDLNVKHKTKQCPPNIYIKRFVV